MNYQMESLEQVIAPGWFSNLIKNAGDFIAGVYDGWNS